jgi:hypothetical protein
VIEPYPLLWPEGQARTESHARKHSPFSVTFGKSRDGLLAEVRRMDGRDPVITTNIATRRDGLPYANQAEPEDPGVALYFWYKGNLVCIACDRYKLTKDNIRAIEKSLDALRGIQRWGATTLVEKALTPMGFLPAQSSASEAKTWWNILQVDKNASWQEIVGAWRVRVKQTHPDQGGNADEYRAVQDAYEEAMEARGQAPR